MSLLPSTNEHPSIEIIINQATMQHLTYLTIRTKIHPSHFTEKPYFAGYRSYKVIFCYRKREWSHEMLNVSHMFMSVSNTHQCTHTSRDNPNESSLQAEKVHVHASCCFLVYEGSDERLRYAIVSTKRLPIYRYTHAGRKVSTSTTCQFRKE